MDLDQLKSGWKEANLNTPQSRISIRNTLHHSGKGPLASLKKNFRKQIILLALICFLIIRRFSDSNPLNNLFFWFFIAFAISLCAFFFINYRLAERLEKMDKPLASYLALQVKILEKRMRWHRAFTRIAALVLFSLAEILPYFTDERMLLKWHALNPFLRVGIYIGFIIFQYFFGKFLARRRYGRHLDRLNELISATEENHA